MCPSPYFPFFAFTTVFKGKTLFQYYLLARLLQRKQVVLFSVNSDTRFLFYHNEVRRAPRNCVSESNLPKPKSPAGFMWSLIDLKQEEAPGAHLINRPTFPVQTTSPNPERYRVFLKDNNPKFTGLPLWTREELARGYVLLLYFLSSFEHTLPA